MESAARECENCNRPQAQAENEAMAMIDRRLLFLAISVGCFAVTVFLIGYANSWWLSGAVTLSIGCWLAGVLYAIHASGERRTTPLAALVCSFLYMLMACGPWFETHVGPWLITTRALVAIDTQLLGHETPAPVTMYMAPAMNWASSTSLSYTNYTVPQATTWPTAQVSVSPTVAIGQWLFAWCAAAIGAFAVRWLRREQPAGRADEPGPVGESPFAESVR
jgi:hypothetical protein